MILKDKICLISGANTGIGKETAFGLAEEGATILMVCRNEHKGKLALAELRSSFPQSKVHLHIADYSNFDSVRNLGDEITSNYPKIDILVNNAAGFFTNCQFTKDGYERQWQINHLSHFLLTLRLMPLLQKSEQARVITVSSMANYKGTIHLDDLSMQTHYDGLTAYRQAKLANVLFTYELARKLEASNITANTLHPGVVATQIGYANNRGLAALVWWLGNPFMISRKKGAETVIYLASSSEVAKTSGKYFEKCREKISAELSYDEQLARKVWQISEESTGEKWQF